MELELYRALKNVSRMRIFEQASRKILKDDMITEELLIDPATGKEIDTDTRNATMLYGIESTYLTTYMQNEIKRLLFLQKENIHSAPRKKYFFHLPEFLEALKEFDVFVFNDEADEDIHVCSRDTQNPFYIEASYKKLNEEKDKGAIYIIRYFIHKESMSDELFKKLHIQQVDNLYGEPYIKWCTGHRNGQIISSDVHLEVTRTIKDEYYPAITEKYDVGIHEFINNFIQYDEPILILTGKKGSGKTELIRHIAATMNTDVTLTFNKELMTMDSFYNNFFSDEETDLLVIEDADVILSKRSDGNNIMDLFLNLSDGLISSPKKKFIFTSNLPNSKNIDDALLRKGRCFAVIDFESLTEEQSKDIIRSLKMDIDDTLKKLPDNPSLADIFAIKNGALLHKDKDNNVVDKPKSTFGFSPN